LFALRDIRCPRGSNIGALLEVASGLLGDGD